MSTEDLDVPRPELFRLAAMDDLTEAWLLLDVKTYRSGRVRARRVSGSH
jgi:hypothetical protein